MYAKTYNVLLMLQYNIIIEGKYININDVIVLRIINGFYYTHLKFLKTYA